MNVVQKQSLGHVLYIENLSVWDLMLAFLTVHKFRKAARNFREVFYINHTVTGKKLGSLLGRMFGIPFRRLNFRMMDIRDKKGELIRIRITRKDLFEFHEKILQSELFSQLQHPSWDKALIRSFIEKGLIDGGIMDKSSASHMLFIIYVVHWHLETQQDNVGGTFLVSRRPWQKEFFTVCLPLGIDLLGLASNPFKKINRGVLKNILEHFPFLFVLLKSFKYHGSDISSDNKIPKLFLDGRGDVHLKNDGHHSDFFWLLNSDFKPENLLYQYHSAEEKQVLESYHINVSSGKIRPQFLPAYFEKPGSVKLTPGPENSLIRSMLRSYVSTWSYWRSFFLQHQVKIYLFWHRFDNHHIAVSDAVHAAGGISVYWPVSFDGFTALECASITDVVFSYSHFSAELEQKNGSKYTYNIITGYPKDYAGKLLKDEAARLRAKLKENGAEKIIFAIDENSLDDDRWHTGHGLQRENYSYILNKLLEFPWLGAIFKPKAGANLRSRLGPINNLLVEAEATGRCFIYEDCNRHTTSAPPLLAGLSADVCIHGHLSSGTAALECALAGLPTLLIDREGTPLSKLHDLPKGRVVFDDWPAAIDATMRHFALPEGTPGFGDWSSILDELDPFRDGLGAKRMGTYLKWLVEGFEQGKEREEVMRNAARKYAEAWGEDKVIIG